jgi:hypothetical protein
MERINTKHVFRVEKSTRETENNSEFSSLILGEKKLVLQKKTNRGEGKLIEYI